MAFIIIDVIPNAQGSGYFDVVIQQGNEIVATWNVVSEEAGHQQVLADVREIIRKHREETE